MIRARKKSRSRQKVAGGRVVEDRIYCMQPNGFFQLALSDSFEYLDVMGLRTLEIFLL